MIPQLIRNLKSEYPQPSYIQEVSSKSATDLQPRLATSATNWLYVVFNCATEPEVHMIQYPPRMGWEPVVKVEHYHFGANEILKSETQNG